MKTDPSLPIDHNDMDNEAQHVNEQLEHFETNQGTTTVAFENCLIFIFRKKIPGSPLNPNLMPNPKVVIFYIRQRFANV